MSDAVCAVNAAVLINQFDLIIKLSISSSASVMLPHCVIGDCLMFY